MNARLRSGQSPGSAASWLGAVLLWFMALKVAAAGLRVGTAAVNINPPMGTPLAGYYHERGCDSVADDLFAKAAVLDDGQTKVAFVVCDLITMPRHTTLEARQLVARQTGIPATNVMIAATHSHTGPVLVRESALDEVVGATNVLCQTYTARLPELIARAVAEAQARLAPTRASFARATEERLAFNRRFWMKDGSVGWNPGKSNPNILRPVGPTDPEVGMVYFESADRHPQLTFVNFAMHPDTTGGTRLSADYPGVLARRLAEYKGPEMLTLFANGACGNLNHLNVQWPVPQSGTNEANRLGTILAGAALKAFMSLQPVNHTSLRVQSETLRLPLASVSDLDLGRAREIAAQGTKASFLDRVQAYKVLDVAAREGRPWEVEVQVVALGDDVAWVSMPGEVFVELGLGLKAASPFKQTYVVELANGAIGYLPNRSAYAEGNYEVVSSRCAAGAGELLVQSALRLLAGLH